MKVGEGKHSRTHFTISRSSVCGDCAQWDSITNKLGHFTGLKIVFSLRSDWLMIYASRKIRFVHNFDFPSKDRNSHSPTDCDLTSRYMSFRRYIHTLRYIIMTRSVMMVLHNVRVFQLLLGATFQHHNNLSS